MLMVTPKIERDIAIFLEKDLIVNGNTYRLPYYNPDYRTNIEMVSYDHVFSYGSLDDHYVKMPIHIGYIGNVYRPYAI